MVIATRWDAGSLDVLFGKPNVKYVALFDLWNYSISVLAHPEKDVTNDSEAVAFPPPCTSGVPK